MQLYSYVPCSYVSVSLAFAMGQNFWLPYFSPFLFLSIKDRG